MKLRCSIMEELKPDSTSAVVCFEDDPKKQHFEIHFKDWKPYENKMRKWDVWEMKIKFESEIFTDNTGNRSYFTHLIGSKMKFISGVFVSH